MSIRAVEDIANPALADDNDFILDDPSLADAQPVQLLGDQTSGK